MNDRVLAGRYRLLSHLARGGMADVYLAQDQLLGRRVAVKVLHPNFSQDAAFVQRFRREAQAAANLSHPNIVGIYDTGREGETYFIVMELIEGRTLREILRTEGPLLPRRAAEIAAEAASALAVAHRRGLVHRDIKPGNIMLGPDGNVKVTDFGIARAWDDSEELTRTGAVIGTATYFSPEQAQGLAADERSDVYSLGVVLYEMLAGRPPFSGESPVSIAYQHVSEFPTAPSAYNPDVSPDLDAIVMRALEKSPERRYQRAELMREDLLRFLQGIEPAAAIDSSAVTRMVAAAPPPPTVPPDETYRQVAGATPEGRRQSSWPFVLTVVGMLLALGAGLFIFTRLLDNPQSPSTEVEVPNVAGQTRDEAINLLLDAELRPDFSNVPSIDVPADVVVSTDPPAGTMVEKGDRVLLVISTGPETFPVPNVEGRDVESARTQLQEAGFVVTTEDAIDDLVPAGTVISQSPAAGTDQAPGTTVNLIVSSGPESVILPSFAGVSEADAVLALASQGVTVVRQGEFSDTVEDGLVIRSDPPSGTEVKKGDRVTLFISKGPEPVEVPALVGSTEARARVTLDTLGLVFEVGTPVEVTDPALIGTVISQSPTAGILVEPGTRVTVRIGVAPATTTTTTTTLPPTTTTTTLPPTTTTTPTVPPTTTPTVPPTTVAP